MGILLRLMMYASPVLYSLDFIPAELLEWYVLNPLAGIFGSIQNCVLGVTAPDSGTVLWSVAVVVVVNLLAHLVYSRTKSGFTKAF